MPTMAVQTPTHLDLDRAGYTLHSCHAAVAVCAGEAGADMHHVREINVIRHVVNSDPGDRLLFFPVIHQFFDFRSVLSNEQVASTAVRNCGNTRDRGLWGITMTEEARNRVVAGMLLMTEGDRLNRRAIPKIDRQNVHERKAGENNNKNDEKPADKPRYFHAVCQGGNRCSRGAFNADMLSPALLLASFPPDTKLFQFYPNCANSQVR
jgi:hypothetical protein